MAQRRSRKISPPKGKILVISQGPFSGIRASLVRALRKAGCQVIEVEHSLRALRLRPLYLLLMLAQALWIYGTRFRAHLNHTPLANWARAKANEKIVDGYEGVDAVITLPEITSGYWNRRKAGVRYAILTDHVNLLSKSNPDFGLAQPEREIDDQWLDVERKHLERQDQNLVMGAFVKRAMVKDYGIDPDKVTVIGGGPNVDVDAERDGVHKNFRQRNILFVGLEGERKGLPVLLRAFAAVHARFADARLHVAGVDGTSGDGVIYYGRLTGEPLRQLFYDAQIFALPSLREPFGIVFLEAMYAKAVCIGTTLGAMPEMVKDGETGFVVRPNDEQQLTARLLESLSDPVRLQHMAEKAYRRGKTCYGWDRAARLIVQQLLPKAENAAGAKHSRERQADYASRWT